MATQYRGHKPVPAPRRSPSSGGESTMSGNHGDLPRPLPSQVMEAAAEGLAMSSQQMSDARAKTVLKEAVDAVVNSFAKHTHGYGRGKMT